MYADLSQFLYLWDLEEQRGSAQRVIIQREGEKPQTTEIFTGHYKKTTQRVDH